MNTRSKSVSNPQKPYITNNNSLSHKDSAMAAINPKTPVVPNDIPKNIADMSVDDKLNMLITSVAKLETIPKDIENMQASITVIQNDLKSIPVLKEKIKTIENDLREHKSIVDTNKNTTAALEISVTSTQKDVDDLGKQIKELQSQMDQNKALIKDFETKIKQDEKKIDELRWKKKLKIQELPRKYKYKESLRINMRI